MVFSVYIINKSGGLIFQRDFGDTPSKLDTNDTLRLASIWCGAGSASHPASPPRRRTCLLFSARAASTDAYPQSLLLPRLSLC